MATVLPAALCAVLSACTLTLACLALRWRRHARSHLDLVVGVMEVGGRNMTAVEYLAERLREHADPDGLTGADADVFADKIAHAARWGEVQ